MLKFQLKFQTAQEQDPLVLKIKKTILNSFARFFITMMVSAIPMFILVIIITGILKKDLQTYPLWIIFSYIWIAAIILMQIFSAYKTLSPLKQNAWKIGLLVWAIYSFVMLPLAFFTQIRNPSATKLIQNFFIDPWNTFLITFLLGTIFGFLQFIGALIVTIKYLLFDKNQKATGQS